MAVIGDAIVDVIEGEEGELVRHPGGAGLNVAVGVSRLGTRCLLATPLAPDDEGRWLAARLCAEGVDLVRLPGSRTSGVARSVRFDGEPVYTFSPSVYHRRYTYPAGAVARIATARVVGVTSFPMADPAQVDRLVELMHGESLVAVVDPNARQPLLLDVDSYREGFLRLVAESTVVKLSEQDVCLLFPDQPVLAVVEQLVGRGPAAVVLTAGERGASVRTSDGVVVQVPVPQFDAPIVDTMGAGDAVLARLLVELASRGPDLGKTSWTLVLSDAMRIAAAVCRSPGGILPAGLTTRS